MKQQNRVLNKLADKFLSGSSIMYINVLYLSNIQTGFSMRGIPVQFCILIIGKLKIWEGHHLRFYVLNWENYTIMSPSNIKNHNFYLPNLLTWMNSKVHDVSFGYGGIKFCYCSTLMWKLNLTWQCLKVKFISHIITILLEIIYVGWNGVNVKFSWYIIVIMLYQNHHVSIYNIIKI